MQISAGSANVTNGSNIVQLPGADLTGVVSGHAFHIRGVDAVYSIIAAAPAASPPTVTLSVNYAGITASGVEYRITTGFSPNNNLYEPDPGDVDIPMLLKHRLVRPIDGGLAVGSTYTTPEAYGAKYDGSDDTAALTAAINNGDHIFLKPGRTYSTNGLTITDRNRIKIFGGGTLKLRDGANASLLKLVSVYRSDIDNIMLDGNKAGQTSGYCHGIEGIDFLFGTVKNCKIYECRNTGLYVYAASVYTDETQLTGNYIDMCDGFGIVVSGTGDHLVKGNHVKFNNSGNIWMVNTYNCTVEGNMVLSAGLDRYTFAVTGQGRGILIEGGRGAVVKGNQCRANTQEGIEIYQSGNAQVEGNFCQYNSMYSAGSYSGILVYDSDDCIVSSNHSADFDYAVQGAPFNVRHQQYGLKIDGNSLRAKVTGNNFLAASNLTGGALITSGSTYTAANNEGLADSDRVYWDIDTQSVNGVQRIRHGFDNFLGNSNFEHWLDGVNAAPSAWTVQGDVTVSRSSTATAGAYSAQLVFGTGNTGELYQVIPTNTVVDYTFSCYVQRTAGTGRARLVAQQADAPYTEFASVELSTVAGWQPAMLTVKPSAGSLLRFAIKSYDNVASTWLIDECMFEESKGIASTWTAAALNDSSDQNVWGVQYFKQRPELQWGAIIRNLPVYADNAAAITGGLTTDTLYRTATGVVMVVY